MKWVSFCWNTCRSMRCFVNDNIHRWPWNVIVTSTCYDGWFVAVRFWGWGKGDQNLLVRKIRRGLEFLLVCQLSHYFHSRATRWSDISHLSIFVHQIVVMDTIGVFLSITMYHLSTVHIATRSALALHIILCMLLLSIHNIGIRSQYRHKTLHHHMIL